MADKKISIDVQLQGHINKSKEDFSKLQGTQAFEGKAGERRLKVIQGLFAVLEGTDLSKLNGKELTTFLNNVLELRRNLDKASQSLSEYTAEQKKILKAQENASEKLRKATDNRQEVQEKRKTAQDSIKNLNKYKFFNTETKRQVTNIDTIVDLIQKNQIKATTEKGNDVKNLQTVLDKTGLQAYADATKEYANAVEAVKQAIEELKAKTKEVENIGSGTGVSPITTDITKTSGAIRSEIQNIKNQESDNTDAAIKKKTTETENVWVKQKDSLGGAFKAFTIYETVLRHVRQALQEGINTIKELDKSLTEQAMVTGMTRQETYQLIGSYQELALQCGATTKEIAGVATEYMKQGKTVQESLVLTEAAVKAAKVARVSVSDSVNYLTTALNGFRLSAEDAMKVSDKFAAVAASSATDYDELAIALSKVASQANLAGMSIDYTTALLTKGLETTREAPETMGTALKTIIARMRELSDYGETLEGDTDVNNVESQLAYVGIALRDTNGELRSTEEVLDELGKKWETLDKNQQAALAKALAGTRQQSRLIAVMDGYERVIELQEISQRSAGATAAQAGVYLEGMEAALNKIQVAWEQIVMAITNNEMIIGGIEWIAGVLDNIGAMLENDVGFWVSFVTLGTAVVSTMLQQWEIQKQKNKLLLDESEEKLNQSITDKQNLITKQRQNIAEKKGLINVLNNLKQNKAITKEMAKQALLDEDKVNDAQAMKTLTEARVKELTGIDDVDKQIAALEGQIAQETAATNLAEAELTGLKLQQAELSVEQLSNQHGFVSLLGNALTLLTPILTIMQLINLAQIAINAARAKGIDLAKKETKEETKQTTAVATNMWGKIVGAFSSLGPWGVPVGIALATAAALALGVAIAGAFGAFNMKTPADNTAKEINDLSNKIYKLEEQANAIDNISNSFDKLDNKIIKTKEDLKEMNSLLDQAAESMDNTEEKNGTSEREFYESLSEKGKRDYLKTKEQKLESELKAKRQEQIDLIKDMDGAELAKFLDEDATDTAILQAQDAIFALNNNYLYDYIDVLKQTPGVTEEAAQSIETMTQAIMENMDVADAWELTQNPEKIEQLAAAMSKLQLSATNEKGKSVTLSAAEILDSTSYSIKDRTKAYEELLLMLEQLGPEYAEVLESFKEQYSGFEVFAKMKDETLDFIDAIGLTNDELNNLYSAWERLQKEGIQISQQEWEGKFQSYLDALAETQGDVVAATEMIFGNYLDESGEAMNAFISAYADLVAVGILNMGQNMDKMKNSINNFYEKALEWNTMSESDKSEFILDNADLFAGESGDQLLKAFQSGNYADIEKALQENEGLQKQLKQRKIEVEQELLIEEAKTGADRNAAYIEELKRYKAYLDDAENLFKASLEVRLEQEKAQLDEYRSYLEEQQSALEDSLNKRKEAYEKYFESINQEEEDKDYEEQANQLITNLSKLGSTSNATAIQQTKELEQQLAELEEERLKELRERAQEAILSNMDDQLEEINEKFDKLLESNQNLLTALKMDLVNPQELISDMIAQQIEGGATALEIEDYIQSLESTFGAVLGNNVDWDGIQVREENNQLLLNVNGTEIALDTQNEQNLYQAIMKALREVGLR